MPPVIAVILSGLAVQAALLAGSILGIYITFKARKIIEKGL